MEYEPAQHLDREPVGHDAHAAQHEEVHTGSHGTKFRHHGKLPMVEKLKRIPRHTQTASDQGFDDKPHSGHHAGWGGKSEHPQPGAHTPMPDDGMAAALGRGDQGAEVAELQQELATLGYYHGQIGGHFGTQTEAALIAFQTEHGLAPDGRTDPATLEALHTAAPATAATQPPATAPADTEAAPAGQGAAAAIAYGMSVLGAPYMALDPYRFGDVLWKGGSAVDIHGKERGPFPAGTQVFDCSGFTTACWRRAGVDLAAHGAAYSGGIAGNKNFLHTVQPDQLQAGDLIAWDGHVVMYIGGGQIIQSTPHGGVKISDAGPAIGHAGAVCKRVPG